MDPSVTSAKAFLEKQNNKEEKTAMEETRKQALMLAHMIASSEEPFSKAIREAEEKLNEYLKEVDPQTQKEIMEKIRGYS